MRIAAVKVGGRILPRNRPLELTYQKSGLMGILKYKVEMKTLKFKALLTHFFFFSLYIEIS